MIGGRAMGAALVLALGGALVLGACGPRKQGARASAAASASGSAALPPLGEDDPPGVKLAEIDLSAGAPEERSSGLLSEEHAVFYDLTEALRKLQEPGGPPGVFVRFGATRLGWGRGGEVARGLKKLREQGKQVVCHADELGNSSYGLAAEGCGQLWLSPAGSVDTVGLGAELIFARDLLARFGVEADIFQVGRFKGTGEMLTRSHASEEVKLSLQGALGGVRERWLEGVDAGRPGGQARAAVERGPYAAPEARQRGLIDQVGYAAEALAELRRKTQGGPVEVVFGSSSGGRGGGLLGLARGLSGAQRARGGRGQIAVLRASGSITMEASKGMLGGGDGIAARPFLKQIQKLAADSSVRAVVLRIDSPGGSALASDLLWFDLLRLRQKKPLIISVGDMAASGGYYMACAGTKIVAEEGSIVGSIGVVGGKVALGKALERYGVNVEVVPADPAGEPGRVAYSSGLIPWDPGARERAVASMQAVYDLFLQRVSQGRGKPVEEIATFAEGRIFAGREGLRRGMIDQLGGLQEAIELARKEASLAEDAGVVLVEQRSSLGDLLGLGAGAEEEGRSLEARLLASAPGGAPWSQGLLVHASTLLPLLRGESTLTALPFALLVR
ncbi:MAG: S49 family peptidase [Polyangiaceae bacterium]|jgi:protease-4|nr:S49 family peptidase [Polyangiaceae bacterium]